MNDTEIVNEILNDISADWGINDEAINTILRKMSGDPYERDVRDLSLGKLEILPSDIVDLITVRESLRRTYTLKTGSRIGEPV